MYTVSIAGKLGAVSARYPDARAALKAYYQVEDGRLQITIIDNRVHKIIEAVELQQHAHAEEVDPAGANTPPT